MASRRAGGGAAVALDGRYRWVIEERLGVLDAFGRPRTVGIGIEGDRVILQIGTGATAGTWISLPPAAAAAIGLHLQNGAVKIDNRKRQES